MLFGENERDVVGGNEGFFEFVLKGEVLIYYECLL